MLFNSIIILFRLYDSSSAVIAEYEIHRILYYAKGNAESNEAPCFAFTWSHGETQESAVFQCHVFRCDIPEAVSWTENIFHFTVYLIPEFMYSLDTYIYFSQYVLHFLH